MLDRLACMQALADDTNLSETILLKTACHMLDFAINFSVSGWPDDEGTLADIHSTTSNMSSIVLRFLELAHTFEKVCDAFLLDRTAWRIRLVPVPRRKLRIPLLYMWKASSGRHTEST